MKQWITDLLALQEIDLRIRNLHIRLATVPEEIRKIEKDLEAEKGKFHAAKETFMAVELQMKKSESAIRDENEMMKKLNLQSAQIKKNDEYKAMMNEIENVRKKISNIETEELVLMEKIEVAKAAYKSEENILKDKEKHLLEEKNELKELEKKLQDEIQKVNSTRQEVSVRVAPSLLSIYTRLISKKTGTPLAEVQDGICGNCHLKLTPQTINSVRKGVQSSCDNCGHLIYMSEE